jgi:hypothetical protein
MVVSADAEKESDPNNANGRRYLSFICSGDWPSAGSNGKLPVKSENNLFYPPGTLLSRQAFI